MREIILEKPRDLCLFSVCYTTLGTDDLAGNTDFSPNIFSIKYVCAQINFRKLSRSMFANFNQVMYNIIKKTY